jgi:CBS-domain-containing membrane protein
MQVQAHDEVSAGKKIGTLAERPAFAANAESTPPLAPAAALAAASANSQSPQRPTLPTLRESALTLALTVLAMGSLAGLTYSESARVQSSGLTLATGSLAASAALLYAAPQSPLAQPRNTVGGHLVSAVVGVVVRVAVVNAGFPGALPLGAALSVGLSVCLMGALGVQHPAGGGTAFLAVASPEAVALGWLFIPSVVLGAGCLVGFAALGGLAGRRYPLWWW